MVCFLWARSWRSRSPASMAAERQLAAQDRRRDDSCALVNAFVPVALPPCVHAEFLPRAIHLPAEIAIANFIGGAQPAAAQHDVASHQTAPGRDVGKNPPVAGP